MRQNIHPDYHEIKVICTCGNKFTTKSTYGQDSLSIEICSHCHPFYTGEQKIIDTEGNVEKFNKKFGKGKKIASKPEAKEQESQQAK